MTHPDPRRDVAVTIGEEWEATPAPDQVDGDIIGTRFRHMDRRIRVRVTFANIRNGRNAPSYGVSTIVRTNEGIYREVFLRFSGQRTYVIVTRLRGEDDSEVRCSVYRSVDYATNVVIIGFPRSCMSNPSWVRMGALGVAWLGDEAQTVTFDDAWKDNPLTGDAWNQTTALSPRICRR